MKNFLILFFLIVFFLPGPMVFAQDSFVEGNNFLKAGDWSKAIENFEAVIKTTDQDAGAHFNLANALALSGQNEKAIAEFEKAIALDSSQQRGFAYFNIGAILNKQFLEKRDPQVLQKAAQYFSKAATIIPDFVLAIDNANFAIKTDANALSVSLEGLPPDSTIFLKENHYWGGEHNLSNVIFDKDSVPELYFYKSPSTLLLLAISQEKNHPATARETYNLALDLLNQQADTNFNKMAKWQAYLRLATLSDQENQWDESIDYIKKAQALNLNNPKELLFLLTAYVGKADYQQAKKIAEEILASNPEEVSAKIVRDFDASSLAESDEWYRDKDSGVKIKKPKGWIVSDHQMNPDFLDFQAGDAQGGIVVFNKNLLNDVPSILVRSRKMESRISLEEYIKMLNGTVERMRQNLALDIQQMPQILNLDNRQFIRYIVILDGKTQAYYYLLNGNTIYAICITMSPKEFVTEKENIEKIVGSLSIPE